MDVYVFPNVFQTSNFPKHISQTNLQTTIYDKQCQNEFEIPFVLIAFALHVHAPNLASRVDERAKLAERASEAKLDERVANRDVF